MAGAHMNVQTETLEIDMIDLKKPQFDLKELVSKSHLYDANPTADELIDILITERARWEQNEHRQSTEILYALLAKCVRLYSLMCDSNEEGNKLREEFDNYIKTQKLKFGGDTHSLVKIARVVFGNDRRSASAYGRVMEIAVCDGVTFDILPAYIRENGGIEAIRKSTKVLGSRESADAKAEKVWGAIKTRCLAVAESEELTKAVDQAKIGVRVVLLATQQVGGKFEIHAVVRANNVVNTAFGSMSATIAKFPGANGSTVGATAGEIEEARRIISESLSA